MAPHYLVRRSRSGRFNFTLLCEHGRINGSVVVPAGTLPKAEALRLAEAKIRALAEAFTGIAVRADEAVRP